MKMDVVPGRVNHYESPPTREGTFVGKCYELCGVYHSRMLFNVEVVSEAEYDAYLAASSRTQGNTRTSRCSAATTPNDAGRARRPDEEESE